MEMSKTNTLVSIIIPVYNAEKYIKEALDSVLKSEYKDIEIIIVNDGSTDNTMMIVNDILKQDSRVKVINKKNEGVSKARNEGMNQALGKYIFFMDADDTLDSILLDKAIGLLYLDEVDVWLFAYKIVDENLDYLRTVEPYREEGKISTNEFKRIIMNSTYMNFCWGKFLKKKFLDENNILFIEGKKIGEDVLFQLELINKNPTMMYKKFPIVNYRQQDNSVMHQFDKSYIYGLNNSFEMRMTLAKEINASKTDMDLMYKDLGIVLLSYIRKMCKSKKTQENIKELKKIMDNCNMQTIVRNIKPSTLSIPQKICLQLLRHKKYTIITILLKVI